MKKSLLLFAIVAVFIMACAPAQQAPAPQPEAEPAQPEVAPEPVPAAAEEPQAAMEAKSVGNEYVTDVACDGKELSWKVTNVGEDALSLKRLSALDTQAGVVPFRITLNGRNVADLEALCGSESGQLAKGESSSCSKAYVGNDAKGGFLVRAGSEANIFTAKANKETQRVEFVCPEAGNSVTGAAVADSTEDQSESSVIGAAVADSAGEPASEEPSESA